MATFAEVPIFSPSDADYHDASSKINMSHLSGATMTDLIKDPEIRIIEPSPSISSRRSSGVMRSKRSSMASTSTTKSALRHSNQMLVEMLQNIQTELSAHRAIMLDIQHRVSHLECESNASVTNDDAFGALNSLEGHSKRTSRLLPPETKDWWQACQNFAKTSDPPMSARDFLRTPKRYSGFDWQYHVPAAKPQTPPASPPDVDDIPALTPTSDGEQTDVDTPRDNMSFNTADIEPPTPNVDDVELLDDTKETTVEVNKRKMPAPPVLQPAPARKSLSITSQEVVEDVAPILDAEDKYRFYKGIRSRMTYKARMRNNKTDKEHTVLIHFHKRKQLQGLQDA